MEKQLSGIGGWLTLLIVGLTIIGPLAGLGQLVDSFESAEKELPTLAANASWLKYKQLSWLVFAVIAAISISAGYRLWKIHKSETVRFAIIALWLVGPLGALTAIIIIGITFGSSAAIDMLPQMAGTFIATCIAAAIWTAYLMRSVRVKNTYFKSS